MVVSPFLGIFHLYSAVYIEFAVKMIYFVAKSLCQKATAVYLDSLALAVESANGYVHRANGYSEFTGNGETTLLTALLACKSNDLGVDQLKKSFLGCFDNYYSAQNAYLRSSKTYTVCGVVE